GPEERLDPPVAWVMVSYAVAERLKRLGDPLHGLAHGMNNLDLSGRRERYRDAQAARRRGRGLAEAAGVGHRVEVERGVADRAGEDAAGAQPVPVVRVRGERHTVALGLEAEQPAGRGRDPDRATAVRPRRRPDQPGRDRSRRAAGRPARGAGAVPRVAGVAEGDRLRPREDRELGHVRLAYDDRP